MTSPLRLQLLGVCILGLLTAHAFGQKVNIEFDHGADFSRYKTFSLRNGQVSSRNPALDSELVKKQIDDDIRHDLAGRGLAEVPDHADLNVVYHFGQARKTELETYPAGWRGWGTRVVRVPYAEGTLVLDLRDTGTHSLVWRAIASVDKSNASKIAGQIDKMVKKSVEKYPPKK